MFFARAVCNKVTNVNTHPSFRVRARGTLFKSNNSPGCSLDLMSNLAKQSLVAGR